MRPHPIMATLTAEELTLREQFQEQALHDPAWFFAEVLQCKTLPLVDSPLVQGGLWEGERQLLQLLTLALSDHKPIYVASGHACGKDFVSAGIPLWWQATRYPAKSILTGPTDRQVHEIVWNELHGHVARWSPNAPPLGGKLMHSKFAWNEEHFILPFTTSHSHQYLGKAHGFHSPHLLVIATEAQAIPNSVKDQLDGLLASGEALFIAIGNPLVTTGWFAVGLRDRTHNVVLHLDCEDSPNVRENREVIPGLVSRAWVEDKRRRWYAENPTHPSWMAKVKGQLPLTSVDSVFDRDLIERSWKYPLIDRGMKVSLGVDVAEFGDDESAFCCLGDGVVRGLTTTSKHEAMDTAGRAVMYRNQQQASVVVIDRLGIGGVASAVREVHGGARDWDVIGFAGSDRPTSEQSPYLNQRAEAYFYAREQLHAGRVQVPHDDLLVDELCETKYLPAGHRGKIQIEPKADIKERLGRSPDRADAWVLAVWGLQFTQVAALPEDLEDTVPGLAGMARDPDRSGSHGLGWTWRDSFA